MLFLIFANRNMSRAINQNVRCHQHRIGVETDHTDTFSRSLPAFSLNWVMRLSQPSRATQSNTSGQLGVLAT